jgi:hypothetical protein
MPGDTPSPQRASGREGHGDRPDATIDAADALSETQKSAVKRLASMRRLQGVSLPPFNLRLSPLVVGPHGSGKTHLIERFAVSCGMPLLGFTPTSWLPHGATSQPHTMDVIRGHVERTTGPVFFHLSHLETLGVRDTYMWDASIAREITCLLTGEGLEAYGWGAESLADFKARFWIVGELSWSEQGKPQEIDPDAWKMTDDAMYEVERRRILPAGLLHAFSADPLLLRYPEAEDFYGLIYAFHRSMGDCPPQAEMDQAAHAAQESRRGFSWFTSYVQKKLAESSDQVLEKLKAVPADSSDTEIDSSAVPIAAPGPTPVDQDLAALFQHLESLDRLTVSLLCNPEIDPGTWHLGMFFTETLPRFLSRKSKPAPPPKPGIREQLRTLSLHLSATWAARAFGFYKMEEQAILALMMDLEVFDADLHRQWKSWPMRLRRKLGLWPPNMITMTVIPTWLSTAKLFLTAGRHMEYRKNARNPPAPDA